MLCRNGVTIKPNMLKSDMLSAITLSVIVPNVVAPLYSSRLTIN